MYKLIKTNINNILMPILYACVINQRREIVLDGRYKKFKSNYNELVLTNYDYFQNYARK